MNHQKELPRVPTAEFYKFFKKNISDFNIT